VHNPGVTAVGVTLQICSDFKANLYV